MSKVWIDQRFGTKKTRTRGDRMKWKRRFIVDGIEGYDFYDEEIKAYAAIRSFIVSKYPVFTGQRIQSLEVSEDENGGGLWHGECTFISPTVKQTLDESGLPEYSFSTKGGTAHVNHSRKTVGVYSGYHPEYECVEGTDGKKTLQYKRNENGALIPVKEAPPNFHCGIGWNGETGSYDGVDIVVPTWSSTLKITVPGEYVDQRYLQMLRMLTGAVNSKPFDGLAPGECLFAGCDGNRRIQPVEGSEEGDEENEEQQLDFVWDLTFEFLGAPNSRKWLDGIGYVFKRGWDYVHVLRRNADYRLSDLDIPGQPADIDPDMTTVTEAVPNQEPGPTPEPDQKPDKSISIPVAAYVEQVYPYADFRVLGFDL